MDWQIVSDLFPATQTYTYLNSPSAPPLSVYAAREGKRYYDEALQHGDVAYDRWLEEIEGVREKLAGLHHTQARQFGFHNNSSHVRRWDNQGKS